MINWIVDHIEAIAGAVSALVTAVALIATWLSWRRSELRRDDVHNWANEGISALQTLRLICGSPRMRLTAAEERARLAQLMVDTSVLVERGRLFFRNARSFDGRHLPRAYRGKRPDILDQLVVAHQIACAWPTAHADARLRMALVAEDVLRRFVTLMQAEVGRGRTASAGTRRRGDGADLAWRMQDLDPDRIALAAGGASGGSPS
ncbi:hypothetical protein ACFQ1E_06390 [Sphingomonas canadensis]|uniref:DUF4760 domain-containing protein n=1 Tax=Sphingomonas canadensis TaxID=1219257 RepID=A0ABW3H3B8_9SPHN|nr:hypothetical protein [Sphingomonas canadensis]MCW3835582.1 hypothetical protein [Sphingomonas canadensis]